MLSQATGAVRQLQIQRIPPDGTVELIFHLQNPFSQITAGRATPQHRAIIVGVWTGPIELIAPNGYDTVGIRIRPGAMPSFWREPAHAFANTVVDADSVWGATLGELQNRLAEAPDAASRLTAIRTALYQRLRVHRGAAAAWAAAITAAHGNVSISALANASAITTRQLERVFLNEIGVSPKMFSRIKRFQRALWQSQASPRRSGPDGQPTARRWIDIACECGYADQSHLIRDFAQFAGETPTTLRESNGTIADYFRR